MQTIPLNEKTIFGLSARTNNTNEMSSEHGKIAGLVHQFDSTVDVNYHDGARVYSVYCNYESDASGDYTVLIGTDKVESSKVPLDSVRIQEGNYLVFPAKGQVPQIVIETWSNIWAYFADEYCPHTRAYSTDVEFYKSQNEIEIYIAII